MRRSGLGRPTARRRLRPSQGSAPGSRGQTPSLRPPRMTRSADCTRASSVPQMARPGWVTTASSGTSRAAISDWRSARYSGGVERAAGVGLGGERVEQRARLRRRRPASQRAWAGAAPGPAASASAAARWRATCSASGARRRRRRAARARRGARRSRRGRRRRPRSAQAARSSQSIQGGAAAQAVASRAGRSRRRWAPRAPGALSTSGCLRRTRRSSGVSARAGQRGEPAQQDAGRGQRQRPAGAVVGDERPSGRARR